MYALFDIVESQDFNQCSMFVLACCTWDRNLTHDSDVTSPVSNPIQSSFHRADLQCLNVPQKGLR